MQATDDCKHIVRYPNCTMTAPSWTRYVVTCRDTADSDGWSHQLSDATHATVCSMLAFSHLHTTRMRQTRELREGKGGEGKHTPFLNNVRFPFKIPHLHTLMFPYLQVKLSSIWPWSKRAWVLSCWPQQFATSGLGASMHKRKWHNSMATIRYVGASMHKLQVWNVFG
jgi:hypothetical protein